MLGGGEGMEIILLVWAILPIWILVQIERNLHGIHKVLEERLPKTEVLDPDAQER